MHYLSSMFRAGCFLIAANSAISYDYGNSMQTAFRNTQPLGTRRVAVIGSGIAGASFVFELQNVFGNVQPFEIVVYEQASHIGGFVNATYLDGGQYKDYTGFAETGGAVFRQSDFCIQDSIDGVGLRGSVVDMPGQRSFHRNSPDTTTGVWESGRLIFERTRDLKPRTKLDYVKDIWRYGTSVRAMDQLVQEKLALFYETCRQGLILNLEDAIRWSGLEKEIKTAANEYFLNAGYSPTYLHEIVEPTTRQLFGRNLHEVNALSALIAMDAANFYRINSHPHGTAELIDRLLILSRVNPTLNTNVTSIRRNPHGRFVLGILDEKDIAGQSEFDAVVITSPLRDLNIDIEGATVEVDRAASKPPANSTHVTFFTAPLVVNLSPKLFGLNDPSQIPDIIYTAGNRDDGILSIEQSEVWSGRKKSDFVDTETLFKITSTSEISDDLIVELLGQPRGTSLRQMHVDWVHRQAWPGYLPSKIRGPPVDLIRILPRLYYTGGASGLLPTMEMSCRLGKMVARGVYAEFVED